MISSLHPKPYSKNIRSSRKRAKTRWKKDNNTKISHSSQAAWVSQRGAPRGAGFPPGSAPSTWDNSSHEAWLRKHVQGWISPGPRLPCCPPLPTFSLSQEADLVEQNIWAF